MKNHLLYYLIITLAGLAILGAGLQNSSAYAREQGIRQYAGGQQAAPTLIPTISPSIAVVETTPESRVLPPVGSNAGLVIGASVLVLIIIVGVLSARRKPNH
jgi:hypothetical protein